MPCSTNFLEKTKKQKILLILDHGSLIIVLETNGLLEWFYNFVSRMCDSLV